jgi:hypothetical protein
VRPKAAAEPPYFRAGPFIRRQRVGKSEGVSLDHGLAADVQGRGAYLCQLHPGRLSGTEDRHALAKRSVGRDLFKGLQEGLGDLARMIVADTTFDLSDSSSLDAQIEVLKGSRAEILVFDVAPAVAARALRKIAELDWRPVYLLVNASASIANTLRPAGLQNAAGVVSTAFLKDVSDPAWKDDPAMKAWSSFMDKYYPDGDKDDINAVFGYAAAETLFQVLSQCSNDLSRENVMRQAASLRGFQSSVALPGITFNTGPADFHPNQAAASRAVRWYRVAADR